MSDVSTSMVPHNRNAAGAMAKLKGAHSEPWFNLLRTGMHTLRGEKNELADRASQHQTGSAPRQVVRNQCRDRTHLFVHTSPGMRGSLSGVPVTWEESVIWRCDEMWRDDYIKLSKEDFRKSTQWKLPLPGRPTFWELPFTRFLGDAWIPKLKGCNTWTEWLSLTKEFEYSWHVMLNLKPPESASVCDPTVWNDQKDHVMTAIHGMLHGHQIHIVVWRFWVTTRLLSTG